MNDWAIILGASSGIGAECAYTLLQKGVLTFMVYI